MNQNQNKLKIKRKLKRQLGKSHALASLLRSISQTLRAVVRKANFLKMFAKKYHPQANQDSHLWLDWHLNRSNWTTLNFSRQLTCPIRNLTWPSNWFTTIHLNASVRKFSTTTSSYAAMGSSGSTWSNREQIKKSFRMIYMTSCLGNKQQSWMRNKLRLISIEHFNRSLILHLLRANKLFKESLWHCVNTNPLLATRKAWTISRLFWCSTRMSSWHSSF